MWQSVIKLVVSSEQVNSDVQNRAPLQLLSLVQCRLTEDLMPARKMSPTWRAKAPASGSTCGLYQV